MLALLIEKVEKEAFILIQTKTQKVMKTGLFCLQSQEQKAIEVSVISPGMYQGWGHQLPPPLPLYLLLASPPTGQVTAAHPGCYLMPVE